MDTGRDEGALEPRRRVAADAGAAAVGGPDSSGQLVWALTLTTFLLWLGASSILPLLPKYLRYHGASDATIGAVMAAYFVAALAFQYLSGYLADRLGQRLVLLGGLLVYAIGSLGFLARFSPIGDIALRALQGAGAGAAEVASLAMVSAAVAVDRRGRAFGSIYGGQVGGMAIGPLVGSLVGVASMGVAFVAASGAALAAGIPVLASPRTRRPGLEGAVVVGGGSGLVLPSFNRALVGALMVAAAFGLVDGVYEACWTLLLDVRHAEDWQIGLSWTLFAVPFVAMARPGGWLADHLDRRWLAAGTLSVSIGLCALYPFLPSLVWLLALGGVEAVAMATALPSAQSLLTQSSPPWEVGRVQGLFSTAETGAVAIAAAAGGALFGIADWAPFVAGAGGAALFAAGLPLVWAPIVGRVVNLESHRGVVTRAAGVVSR